MGTQRWPWRAAGTLLLVAAAATAVSTYLHWLPCRGSMLSGSIFRKYAYGPGFSDACLRRMDGGPPFPYPPEPAAQGPWSAELGVAGMALAALAWLVLVLGLRFSPRATIGEPSSTLVALLPGLSTFVVAVIAGFALGDTNRSPDAYLPVWAWVSIDLTAMIALIAVGSRPEFRRLALALGGVTAFGFVQSVAAYMFMTSVVSDANWDSPPGTGYLTAATLLVSGVVTLALAGSAGQELQDRRVPLVGLDDQDPVRTFLEDHQH